MTSPFGGFTAEALAAYQKALAEQSGTDFAEGDSYDFTTCIRPDGSAYGTGGKCRKGSEGEAKAKENKGGMRDSSVAESRKAMKHQREQMNLHGNKIAELQDAGKKVPPALQAKYNLAKASYNVHRKAINDATGVMNSPVMRTAREAGRAEEKKNQEKRAIQRGEERVARAGEQSKVTATPGMAARVKAAKEKLKADKAANGGKRLDRIQEERRLEQNRKQRETDRKVKANQGKQEEMLRQPAKKPEAQDATTRALEMVKANARARGLTEIKAGGSKPSPNLPLKEAGDAFRRALRENQPREAVKGYDWRKQSGTFNKADND